MIPVEAAGRISDALDAIDALELERKLWLEDWKRRMESARGSLNMFREDVRQMRLDEVEQ